jgi:cell filamentation protein
VNEQRGPSFSPEVLPNLLGITDWWELHTYEHAVATQRQTQLALRPIAPTFDTAHLQAIHRHLFQDVYGWAGQFRTVNIRRGDSHFIGHTELTNRCNELFNILTADKHLVGLSHGQFTMKATALLTNMNMVHPFREGNGRTQRIFINQIAGNAGWSIDWAGLDKTDFDDACRSAHLTGNRAVLVELLGNITAPTTSAGSSIDFPIPLISTTTATTPVRRTPPMPPSTDPRLRL